jgi:hypothetical protein
VRDLTVCDPLTSTPCDICSTFLLQCHFQDWSFGTSPFLTASDYEVPARFPEFATRSVLSQNIWAFTIKGSHLPRLNRTSQTQFRVRATLATFTNRNGASQGLSVRLPLKAKTEQRS